MPAYTTGPKNPSQGKMSQVPAKKGETRGQGAALEYQDSRDLKWKPAVRLEDIRIRLIQEAPPTLYDHPKEHGYDATDVTTFLEKDKAYGGEREHRPPLLFQIQPTDGRAQKPTGYMKDRDRIVLDAFDHGIRDFPEILPKALSSELAGHDIMYYFRQNEEIHLYDLVARMPNGYHEKNGNGVVSWHEGPPRYGTVGMRATRFRLQAGLLTWKRRMGSDARNAKILSFIPDECKDPKVNSTRSFRDLTPFEQDAIAKVLRGSAPNRARKAKGVEQKNKEIENTGENCDGFGVDDGFEVPNSEDDSTGVLAPGFADNSLSQSNNKSRPYKDRDSDSSGNDSDRHLIKRQRIHVSGKGLKTLPKHIINSFGSKGSSHRGAMPSRQARKKPAVIEISDDEMGTVNNEENASDDEGSRKRRDGSDPEGHEDSENEPEESQSTLRAQSPPPTYLDQDEADAILSNDPLTARLANAASITRQTNRSTRRPSTIPTWIQETTGKDFRIIVPNAFPETAEDNIAAIQDALELTRIDFFNKTGWRPRPSLIEEHKDQSYTMQHHALQQELAKAWRGKERVPELYLMPRWEKSFRNWKVEEEEAQELYLESKKGKGKGKSKE